MQRFVSGVSFWNVEVQFEYSNITGEGEVVLE